jgi:YspA, cpYpsA-related SLOG family
VTSVPGSPEKKLRAIVCGGRDYHDRRHLAETLDSIGITDLAHGAARGVDALAHDWAWHRGVAVTAYPADWEKHGRAAGVLRNQQMLDEFHPDLVIAFPGGRGTADMVRRATAANVQVISA